MSRVRKIIRFMCAVLVEDADLLKEDTTTVTLVGFVTSGNLTPLDSINYKESNTPYSNSFLKEKKPSKELFEGLIEEGSS